MSGQDPVEGYSYTALEDSVYDLRGLGELWAARLLVHLSCVGHKLMGWRF